MYFWALLSVLVALGYMNMDHRSCTIVHGLAELTVVGFTTLRLDRSGLSRWTMLDTDTVTSAVSKMAEPHRLGTCSMVHGTCFVGHGTADSDHLVAAS